MRQSAGFESGPQWLQQPWNSILTAARSGEVLGARWAEFDLAGKVWTVPAARMKAAREHRVPLSGRAVAIVKELAEAKTGEFVFPGQRPGKPLSGMALEMILRRMKIEATPHGFRSAFRDWAGDATHFPRELAEAALAHVAGDATEQAYRRGDALEKRRSLMEAWAQYCEPGSSHIALAIAGRLPWSLKRAWNGSERQRKLDIYQECVREIGSALAAIETLRKMGIERCETSRVSTKRDTKLWKRDFAYWVGRLWVDCQFFGFKLPSSDGKRL
jgi:Phage integrase family